MGCVRTTILDQTAGLEAQRRDLGAVGAECTYREQISSIGQRTDFSENDGHFSERTASSVDRFEPTDDDPMRRKIAAILAADVVGYSRLVAEDEESAIACLVTCRSIFEEHISRGYGRIFNTAGDAVLAEFSSSVEALRAALDIQSAISTRNEMAAENRQMMFRIDITVGDVIEKEGDLLGDAVNVAARLESIADPGGVCVSKAVYEQVGNKISISFKDGGRRKVKNIPEAIHVFNVRLVQGRELPRLRKKPKTHLAIWMFTAIAACACLVTFLTFSSTNLLLSKTDHSSRPPVMPPATPPSLWRPNEMIYGPSAAQPNTSIAQPATALFDASKVPFVLDRQRVFMADDMARAPNKALALTQNGTWGEATGKDTVDEARSEALASCRRSGGFDCRIYAVNNQVVWPKAFPPMPASPWVDSKVDRIPFDQTRIAGVSQKGRDILEHDYVQFPTPKALALANDGSFHYSTGADDGEAIRRALERCGDENGSACRIIAVNSWFVVSPGTTD